MRNFDSKYNKCNCSNVNASQMEENAGIIEASDNYEEYSEYENEGRSADYPLQTIPSHQPVPDFSQPSQVPSMSMLPNMPSTPTFPSGIIGPIVIPIGPGSIGYAQVRFLHAVAGAGPVMISVGPTVFNSKLAYQNITAYGRIASGYRTITVVSADNPSNVLLRKSVTFTAGSQITIALVNAASGIQLLVVSDELCSNKSWNSSCVRFVNLSYGSGSLSVQLDTGMSVFEDIDFMEITPFKQIGVGNYYFNVYQSSPGIQPRNISGDMGIAGFTSFELQVGSNEMYTVYLVGSTFTTPSLQAVIVTNV